MLNLTDVERRILINQSRILAALYPLEAPEFERTIEILSEGYHEGWQDVVLKGLKAPFPKEEMNFVYQVLEMYDWLQKSFYAISLEDKVQLKEQTLVFPGFDPRTERSHQAYATFLIERLDRFAFVEVTKPLAAPVPMRAVYEEMLKGLPSFGADVLSATQLKAVIAYMSAIKSPPVQTPRRAAS
ncbi:MULTISPECIES: YfbU family protein [Rhodomicrobium]|uniref:YfbU family protein n=1 Tax=Rhodomicrobium TaxID=1068 RepID=UPI001482006E|nr:MULTISPECIES: YfbU family protein [Rhodomicrobium]